MCFQKREKALCFNGNEKKIDFILVHKGSDEKNEEEDRKQEIRKIYQANLRKNGVETETEPEAVSKLWKFTI